MQTQTGVDKFIDLLKESVIVQGLLTLIVVGTWCAMYLRGQAPPENLTIAVFTVIAFYFGQKITFQARRSDLQAQALMTQAVKSALAETKAGS